MAFQPKYFVVYLINTSRNATTVTI